MADHDMNGLTEPIRQEVLAQIRAENREYQRQWRAKNKEKVKAKNERYILRKAERLKAEAENS